MKKIGILSMQRIYNYGSFLQAYGLKKILEELGGDVTFVDYHPGKCVIAPKVSNKVLRKFYKSGEILCIQASFIDKINFLKYKKNYARNYFHYLGIDELCNYNPELDVLLIGSDEVFNCIQDNVNVGYSPELFGEGCRAKVLMSYAASFGNTTLQKLEQYGMEKDISYWMKKFDMVSVRDINSYNIVNYLTGSRPEIHLDPVLIYDYMKKCPYVHKSISYRNYLIVYGYSGRFSKKECMKIREFARQKDLKILCIGGIQHYCDKFIECSPFEVFAYFQHAYAVITDTFHGTIFSIITHQKFCTIIRNSGYGNAEKISDLLNRLNLCEQILQDIKDIKKIVEKPVSYQYVDDILIKERKRSYDYLGRVMEDRVKNE